MPRLSVILPVYNAEQYLDRAVDSVLEQRFRDWELILVDDGSTDASPSLCDARAAADRRIRAIHQANAGPSESRNRGMDAAAGEYIAFLDADDRLDRECYARLFEAMDAAGGDCACCGYVPVWEGGSGALVPPPLSPGAHEGDEITRGLVLPLIQDRLRADAVNGMVWRWLFRREEIAALSLRFYGGYYEDEMFLIHYFSRPRRLVCAAEGLYYYYECPTSVTHRYFPGFVPHYLRILSAKAAAVADYALPVRSDWRDNCAWAGLLAAVGNEFAPGGPHGLGTHLKNLREMCAIPDFAHALAHYVPRGMNRRKALVAALLRKRLLLPLCLLYAVKNRG